MNQRDFPPGTVLASTSATITDAGLKSQVGVKAGTSLHDYKITVTAALEDELIMHVRDF